MLPFPFEFGLGAGQQKVDAIISLQNGEIAKLQHVFSFGRIAKSKHFTNFGEIAKIDKLTSGDVLPTH
jgi:hypothetical protein